jgi:hypothetical protein
MPETHRQFIERRSARNRRRLSLVHRRTYRGPDRRRRERRDLVERRDGWIRVTKWSSAPLKDLKIAKYLLKYGSSGNA